MKIAYLFGSLNRGGTETLMLDVCQNLKKEDFEAIGIYRKSGVLEQDFKISQKFINIPFRKNIFAYFFRLRKFLLNENIDIIHAQQPMDALLAKIACLGTNKKIVLTLHGFDFTSSSLIINFVLKITDENIYVSEKQRQYYIEKYHLKYNKQAVIYNGINFTKLEPGKNQSITTLRDELGLSKEIILIGMVGNFNDGRDPFTVCKFLKLLDERKINFHFVFIGKRIEASADKYDKCVAFCDENTLNEKVSFLGVRNDVPKILSQLNAFVYSTEHDTFGIAVVEAIAAGIPVFVNDWDVMNEITENGKLATSYKTKDEMDLVEKFMVFLQNKKEYEQKAVESATIVKGKYSIEQHIQKLKEIYYHLLR